MMYLYYLITIDINVDAILTMVDQLKIRNKVGLSQCTLLYTDIAQLCQSGDRTFPHAENNIEMRTIPNTTSGRSWDADQQYSDSKDPHNDL